MDEEMRKAREGFRIRCGLPGSTEGMAGTGDLALCLSGKTDPNDLEVKRLEEIFLSIAKNAGYLESLVEVGVEHPRETAAYLLWMNMSPIPTADQFMERFGLEFPQWKRTTE